MQINLRRKFILYFAPLIVGIFLFGGYCIVTFSSIHQQFAGLQSDVTPNVLGMMELRRVLLALEVGIDEKRIDQAEISRQLKELQKIVATHADGEGAVKDPEQRASHKMLHHAIRTMGLSRYILKQSTNGWQGEDLAEIAEIIRKERLALGPILDEHLAIHLKQLADTELFVSEKYRTTLILVGVAIAVILLLTFFILLLMMRQIVEPVKALQEGARQLGAGNLTYKLKVNTGDELEFLAGEFNDMAAKLFDYHARMDNKVQARTRELVNTNEELTREIVERQKAEREQLRAEEQIHFLTQEVLKVQESERQRISLDLHDNVAQELSSLKVAGETILADLAAGDEGLAQQIKGWEKLLARCIKTVRELSYNLRPPALEQMGIANAVADYCRSYSKDTGIAVDFSAAGMDMPLAYNYSINIYRLVQEALHNINKHAGAEEVSVRLLSSHPHIILRIIDNGAGFDLPEGYRKARLNKRLGLLGMEERVRMLGGSFKISSEIGAGTRIKIEIPLAEEDEEHAESIDH